MERGSLGTGHSLESEVRKRFPPKRAYEIAYRPLQRLWYPGVKLPVHSGSPGAEAKQLVVRVADEDELSWLLRVAAELDQPVYVRQGTGVVTIDLLNPIPPGAVVIDLRLLTSFKISQSDGFVEVGAGLTLIETNRRLEPLGFRFPVAVEAVTWGGLASINMGGHLVDSVSGRPGDYVLGMRVVLPGGEVIETGTRSLRKLVGPDLTRVFIGSQGLLGIITELRLRLVPAPGGHAWGWALFDEIEDVATAAQQLYIQRRALPSVCELIDKSYVAESVFAELTGDGSLLLVATEGVSEADAEHKLTDILGLATDCGASQTSKLSDHRDWEVLWRARHDATWALREREWLIGEAMDVRLSRLAEALGAIGDFIVSAESRWPGLKGHIWAHIASVTLHPVFACPSQWTYAERADVARQLRSEVRAMRLGFQGTVGEQGIFPEHAEWFEEMYGTRSLELIRGLKSVFDPRDLLNRGRLKATD